MPWELGGRRNSAVASPFLEFFDRVGFGFTRRERKEEQGKIFTQSSDEKRTTFSIFPSPQHRHRGLAV